MALDRPGARRSTPTVHEDPAVALSHYPGTLRQLAVTGLGHDAPTIIITNNRTMGTKAVIEPTPSAWASSSAWRR